MSKKDLRFNALLGSTLGSENKSWANAQLHRLRKFHYGDPPRGITDCNCRQWYQPTGFLIDAICRDSVGGLTAYVEPIATCIEIERAGRLLGGCLALGC